MRGEKGKRRREELSLRIRSLPFTKTIVFVSERMPRAAYKTSFYDFVDETGLINDFVFICIKGKITENNAILANGSRGYTSASIYATDRVVRKSGYPCDNCCRLKALKRLGVVRFIKGNCLTEEGMSYHSVLLVSFSFFLETL